MDGCVTLLVPVQFPMPCVDAAAFEESILDNLGQLDFQPMMVIQERIILKPTWKKLMPSNKRKLHWAIQRIGWFPSSVYNSVINKLLMTPHQCHCQQQKWKKNAIISNDCSMKMILRLKFWRWQPKPWWSIIQKVTAMIWARLIKQWIIVRTAISTIQIFDEQPHWSMLEIPIPFSNAVTNVKELRAAFWGWWRQQVNSPSRWRLCA